MPVVAQMLIDERAFHDALNEVFRLAPLIGVTWLNVESEESRGCGYYTREFGVKRAESKGGHGK